MIDNLICLLFLKFLLINIRFDFSLFYISTTNIGKKIIDEIIDKNLNFNNVNIYIIYDKTLKHCLIDVACLM